MISHATELWLQMLGVRAFEEMFQRQILFWHEWFDNLGGSRSSRKKFHSTSLAEIRLSDKFIYFCCNRESFWKFISLTKSILSKGRKRKNGSSYFWETFGCLILKLVGGHFVRTWRATFCAARDERLRTCVRVCVGVGVWVCERERERKRQHKKSLPYKSRHIVRLEHWSSNIFCRSFEIQFLLEF